MTAGADTDTDAVRDQRSPDLKSAAGGFLSGFPGKAVRPYWRELTVVGVAFFLRWFYLSFILDHRVIHFGDAYNYLVAGKEILGLFQSPHGFAATLGRLLQAHSPQASALQMMTSDSLVDRLLIDGPVYPAYLAFIEWLVGVNVADPRFDTHWYGLGMANAVVDTLTCLLIFHAGRLSFGRGAGLIAALLFAVYPGAVINIQHCYSEPFAYFLLTAWAGVLLAAVLPFQRGPGQRAAVWCGLGLLSGLVMLVRPAFVLIPPAVALVLIARCLAAGRLAAAAVRDDGEASEEDASGADSMLVDPGESAEAGEAEEVIESTDASEPPQSSDAAEAAPTEEAGDLPAQARESSDADESASSEKAAESPGGSAESSEATDGTETEEATAPVRPAADATRLKSWTWRSICLFGGLLVVLAPWLLFTQAATGRMTLFVNRVPAYNFFIGNFLPRDGWKAYPLDYPLSRDMSEAVSAVTTIAVERPFDFLALELRKVPRLWAGVWNENQYWLPYMDPDMQTVFHGLLLLVAFIGALFAFFGHRRWWRSRAVTGAAIFAVIILLHFAYCAFEPVSRYNSTAMPFVAILAGYGLVRGGGSGGGSVLRLLGVIAGATILIQAMVHRTSLVASFADLLLNPLLPAAPWLDGLFWSSLWLLLAVVLLRLFHGSKAVVRPRQAGAACLAGIAVVAVVALCLAVRDPERNEWYAELSTPQHVVRQDVYVPPMAALHSLNYVSFVLVDLQSPVMLPKLAVAVNGQPVLHVPMPWLQVKGDVKDIMEVIGIQSQAMGRDPKTFRQWWAIPVPTALLRFGQANEIMITTAVPELQLPPRIYGDYPFGSPSSGEVLWKMPSFDWFSWTKGFATYDHHDPRVYELVRLLGKWSDAHWHDGKAWRERDVSDNPGRQFGQYRIRLALPVRKTRVSGVTGSGPAGLSHPPLLFPPIAIVSPTNPQTVLGSDPRTMMLTSSPLKLPQELPSGSVFLFSCELKDFEFGGSASISVEFSGEEDGKTVTWTSPWQPPRVATSPNWWPTSFADIIPDRILNLENLRVTVMVAPFHSDQLFMHRKRALKDSVAVRNASFVLLPPVELPPPEERKWLFY